MTDHLLCPQLQQTHVADYAGCKLLVAGWCTEPVAEQSQSSLCTPSKHVYKLLSTTSNIASPDSTEKHVEHRLSVDAKLSPCI